MAWGRSGRSALTIAGTADNSGVISGTAGTGAGIEMGLLMGCGLCILAGNGWGGGGGGEVGLFSSISILLEGRAGTEGSLATKSISILKLGDTLLGLTGAGMNLSCSPSWPGAGAGA